MKSKPWIINAERKGFDLNLSELSLYKYLLRQLIYRDFVASYKQTLLGPAWFIVHPILSAGIFTIVFGRIIKVSTEQLPPPLFYLTGITAWNYFSECLNRTASVFRDNVNIFGKVYFPRIILPICSAVSLSLRLSIQLIIIAFLICVYKCLGYDIPLSPTIFAIPFLVLLIAMQGVGIGLIIGSLTVRYRDLSFLLAFGLQLLMYTTTVIFPLSAVPEKSRFLVQLNPMTTIIEAFRFVLLGTGNFGWMEMAICSASCMLFFTIGLLIFNRVQRTFIDII
ncbi:MAG: ABC transporter permease [Bacteroidota bacterium]